MLKCLGNYQKLHIVLFSPIPNREISQTVMLIFQNLLINVHNQDFMNILNFGISFCFLVNLMNPAVTYATALHQGRLFWITCKRLKLLRIWEKLVTYKIQRPLLFGGVNVTSELFEFKIVLTPLCIELTKTPFEVSQTSSVHSSDRFSTVCYS